jgi:Flp pilus assembly protein TadG
MRNLRDMQKPGSKGQRGTAAVEFALIAIVFFTLLLGIIEFGRVLYVWNSVQEVTRRAAREAVVLWVDQADTARSRALFGGASLPAGAEITAANISIEYLNASGTPASLPSSPTDNLNACLDPDRTGSCIRFVEVSLTGAQYVPMIGLFTFLSIDIPASTVVMPAESLGYTP